MVRPAEKTAHVYEALVSTPKRRERAKNVDWSGVLRQIAAEPIQHRTLDDVTYEPFQIGDSKWLLAMHRPVNKGFLSTIDETSGSITDYLPDVEGQPRFLDSTVVGFLEPGITVAYCKGNPSAPGHSDLIPFLTKYAPQGSGEHWTIEPVIDADQRKQFKSTRRARRYRTKFSTARSLFSDEQMNSKGIIHLTNLIAESVGTELEINIDIKIPRGAQSREAEERFHDMVVRNLDETAPADSRATVEARFNDGAVEALRLVAHAMTITMTLPPESTERQSFRDLSAGLYEVLPTVQSMLREQSRR